MIFYLDNEDRILLYITGTDVVYVHYCHIMNGPTKTDLRWKEKDIFQRAHMEDIIKFMTSPDPTNKKIGLEMLKQTLKVVINGEIVGHVEQSIR